MADTTEKTVAGELREAAAKLREKASAAPAGPWNVDGPWWWDREPATCSTVLTTEPDRDAVAVIAPEYNRHPKAENAAPWIALVSPALAEPLASWLESAAVWHDETTVVLTDPNHVLHHACGGVAGEDCQCFVHPLAVARVVNGTAS
jgi:hypothetical protein